MHFRRWGWEKGVHQSRGHQVTHNFPSCGGGDDPRREGRKRKSLPRQAFCANIIHGFFVDRAYLYWSKCQSAGRPSLSLELHSTIWTSTQNIFLPGISLNNVIGGSFRSGPTHETATPLGRSPKKHSLAGEGESVRLFILSLRLWRRGRRVRREERKRGGCSYGMRV